MRGRRLNLSAEHRRAARERWALLSPYHRKLIAEEMPNELEREEEYRRRTFAALEWRNGPRQWDATVAILAEGDAEEVDRMTASDREPDGMTYDEIGEELGRDEGRRTPVSRERVRQIMLQAMGKLRALPVVQEMFFGEPGRQLDVAERMYLVEMALSRLAEEAA